MSRQDVPYGGAICRLKERIAEIWDKLGEKLHSVNGVTGDAAGDVKIVSGDAAITISDDQVNHQITIGLDQTELPSAAVTRVNRKTGDVVLNAQDIYDTDNHATVQSMINGLLFDETNLKGSINSEAQARQAADNALQTNINAVSASIPEMSVTPDPYKGVERDAQGRAFAADPASGATDKSLVTANWISQTGSGAPNNALHTNGNETKSGELTLINNLRPLSFIINNNGDNRIPATNKNFQIEVDGAEGFTHYISFRSNTDGSRSLIHTIYSESGTNAYFNLEVAADGTRYIATNFPKPPGW